MRYREATRRPGRKRPSFSPRYSAELEGRSADDDEEARFGGNGELEVAKSSVATSSVFEVGCPHEEQKRTLSGNSVSQFTHLAMKISRTSLNQSARSNLCLGI